MRNDKISTVEAMWTINCVLMFVAIVAIWIFGFYSLLLIFMCVGCAILTEGVIQKVFRQKLTIGDGSAFMTGLLLAFNLPPRCPLWVGCVGSIFAILVAKQVFGGLGRNIFNPTLAARAFLMVAWPQYLAVFTKPFVYDAVAQATPLSMIKEGKATHVTDLGLSYWDLFVGNHSGSLGEVCILMLVLGGIYLLYRRIITWHIPVTFIATTGIMVWAFKGDFLSSVLSGGLVLGAIYMATDYATSPVSEIGQIIFGIGCGLLTAVIRLWGGYPEGVCYAVLIMNLSTPLLDRLVLKKYIRNQPVMLK